MCSPGRIILPALAGAAGGRPGALGRVPGLLVSVPDSDHHRGRIARAEHNVTQSRIELAQAESQVVLDVRLAHLEYTHSLAARRRLKDEVLPAVQEIRERALKLFQDGEADIHEYKSRQTDYNEVVQIYLKAAIRHRRAALALNTAVGKSVIHEPP